MAYEIGPQYSGDDDFKKRARLHQSIFRAQILNVQYDKRGNYLTEIDGFLGLNFFGGLGIREAVNQYKKKFDRKFHSNLLRSEHIPFNLFVPFRQNQLFLTNVLREVIGEQVSSVSNICVIDDKPNIKIEFKPKHKQDYIGDATSFDTYIEYDHRDGSKGFLGIEVKYTEQGYKLRHNRKEAREIVDPNSLYHTKTKECKSFAEPIDYTSLKSDRFRQVWRNQLLGESVLLNPKHRDQGLKHFTSVTFFPKGNVHFIETSELYPAFLKNKERFKPVTYEAFFDACEKHCPNEQFREWITYLRARYIVE